MDYNIKNDIVTIKYLLVLFYIHYSNYYWSFLVAMPPIGRRGKFK